MATVRRSISAREMDRWLETKFRNGTIRSIHYLIPTTAMNRKLSPTEIAGFHLQLAMALTNAPNSQYQLLVKAIQQASRIGFQAVQRSEARQSRS